MTNDGREWEAKVAVINYDRFNDQWHITAYEPVTTNMGWTMVKGGEALIRDIAAVLQRHGWTLAEGMDEFRRLRQKAEDAERSWFSKQVERRMKAN